MTRSLRLERLPKSGFCQVACRAQRIETNKAVLEVMHSSVPATHEVSQEPRPKCPKLSQLICQAYSVTTLLP